MRAIINLWVYNLFIYLFLHTQFIYGNKDIAQRDVLQVLSLGKASYETVQKGRKQ